MDHGGHMGQHGGGMEMFEGCTMRHLWNSDYKSTCIVHPAIQVHSIASLLFYMLLLFALGVFYEWSRLVPARLEARFRASESYKVSARSSRSTDHVHAPLLGERDRSGTPIPLIRPTSFTMSQRIQRSAVYTLNVALSFFLMLVTMTFNAYLIAAVLAGAFCGHFVFHDGTVVELDRGMACH